MDWFKLKKHPIQGIIYNIYLGNALKLSLSLEGPFQTYLSHGPARFRRGFHSWAPTSSHAFMMGAYFQLLRRENLHPYFPPYPCPSRGFHARVFGCFNLSWGKEIKERKWRTSFVRRVSWHGPKHQDLPYSPCNIWTTSRGVLHHLFQLWHPFNEMGPKLRIRNVFLHQLSIALHGVNFISHVCKHHLQSKKILQFGFIPMKVLWAGLKGKPGQSLVLSPKKQRIWATWSLLISTFGLFEIKVRLSNIKHLGVLINVNINGLKFEDPCLVMN